MTDKPDRQDDGLLPCPLCQSINIAAGTCFVEASIKHEPAVRCSDCGCRATLKAWNTRAPSRDAAEGAVLRHHANETLEEQEYLLSKSAPPKPAPDALRHNDGDDFLTQARKTIGHLSHAADVVSEKPVPNFDLAALALGFVQKNGKWFATTSSPDRNTAQSWASAEQIFEWWGRASGNVENPAPDAMRLREAELALAVWDNGRESEYWFRYPEAAEFILAGGDAVDPDRAALSAPVPTANALRQNADRAHDQLYGFASVPPADGARKSQGLCDTTLTERFVNPKCRCDTYEGNLGPCKTFEVGAEGACVYCDHDEGCPPSPAVAAEPDATQQQRTSMMLARSAVVAAEPVWLWRTISGRDKHDDWILDTTKPEFINPQLQEVRLLYTAPPVSGDREAIARSLAKSLWSGATFDDGTQAERDAFLNAADDLLSLPVQPGAGERGSDAAEADRYFNLAGEFGNRIQRAVTLIDDYERHGSVDHAVAFEMKKILDSEHALSRQAPHSGDGGGR